MAKETNQIYEEYWHYTAAYTKLNSSKFLTVLKSCLDFLDKQDNSMYTEKKYDQLQTKICKDVKITPLSARKAINQLVKLGFLKPLLQGYVAEAKEYLDAKTERKRQSLLSKIVYRDSNFNNSMTAPNDAGQGQINFLIKTLTEVGCIDDGALTALMSIDINDYAKGYLDQDELNDIFHKAQSSGFIDRKYNQISHLKNLLSRLDDLQVVENVIYFKTDAEDLFGRDMSKKIGRDSYLQRIYKYELFDESCTLYGCAKPKCMLENRCYPVLIASHIKPYKVCDEKDQFNVNNGLLLSRNIDSLFDLGYITFDDKGTVIPSQSLERDVVDYLVSFKLDKRFINPERMKYMKYHRQFVFEKRFKGSRYKKK